MSNRTEYCIINNLDDCRGEINDAVNAGYEYASKIRKMVSNIADGIGCTDQTVLDRLGEKTDEIDDCIDELDCTLGDVETFCSEFDNLLDEAESTARQGLDDARDEGYDEGRNECDSFEDCIEHYEELIRKLCIDSNSGIDAHLRADVINNMLREERFDY